MDQELADFYKLKLRQFQQERVGLNITQAIAVIGVTRLEEVSQFVATITNDMQMGRRKPRSVIPPNKRFKKEGFVMVDRIAFLKAIEETENELLNRQPNRVNQGSKGTKSATTNRNT